MPVRRDRCESAVTRESVSPTFSKKALPATELVTGVDFPQELDWKCSTIFAALFYYYRGMEIPRVQLNDLPGFNYSV